MKRILTLLIVVISLSNCRTAYPNQSTEDRKPVPKTISYIVSVPLIKKVGNVKYIHDVRNNAFILFKGKEDTLLQKIIDWLPANANERGDKDSIPVARCTMTSIAPFTLFSRSELTRQTKKRLIEMANYNTYSITVLELVYKDQLDENEKKLIDDMQKVVTAPVQVQAEPSTQSVRQGNQPKKREFKNLGRKRP